MDIPAHKLRLIWSTREDHNLRVNQGLLIPEHTVVLSISTDHIEFDKPEYLGGNPYRVSREELERVGFINKDTSNIEEFGVGTLKV